MKLHSLIGGVLLAVALSSGVARAAVFPFKTIPLVGAALIAAGSAVVHHERGVLYVADADGVAVVETAALVIPRRLPTASGQLVLDEPNNRLYVLHRSGNIDVFDTSTDSEVKTIALPDTYYETMEYNALSRRLYVTSTSAVSVVDTNLNEVVATLGAVPSSHALCINAATNRIYVLNRYDDSMTVIDGATNLQVAGSPVALGSRPWTCSVDAVRNRVIVTKYLVSELSVIDGATNAVSATIPVSMGAYASIADDSLNLLAIGGGYAVSLFRLDTLAPITELRLHDSPASFVIDALGLALYVNPEPPAHPTVIELRKFTEVPSFSSNAQTLVPYRNRCFLIGSVIDVYKCPSFRREWDLNNDGTTDLAWYNTATKENALSLMDGTTTIDSAITLAPSDWIPVLRSDLDGDGYGDLVFRNATTHETAAWFMKGLAPRPDGAAAIFGPSTYAPIFAVECGYAVAHCLVWRDSVSGTVAYWYMPTGPVPEYAQVIYAGEPGWTPMFARDFDGDDHGDLLWRHTDGRVALWLMQGDATAGFSIKAAAVILGPGTGWVPKIATDLDSDGLADILWQNAASNDTAVWLMDGLGAKPGGTYHLMDGASGWTVSHVASEPWGGWLVWRHLDGSTAAGTTNPSSHADYLSRDPHWSVTHAVQADVNGEASLLWRNSASGQTQKWVGVAPFPRSAVLSNDPGWRVVPAD